MRPLYASSRALKDTRAPLALFSRNGPRRSLHDHARRFDAAVIGGGITGLTAAYRLSKDPLCSNITLYEKAPRVGGWLESEIINVDGGDIVFEYGPRTLRLSTSSIPLLDLLADLDLEDDMLVTPRTAPAAQNRYIYYPDHLVRVPAPQKGVSPITQITTLLSTLLREPLFETFLWSLITEAFKEPLPNMPEDESVTDFISRRWSPEVANNLVSSMYHGILAGDIDKLSAEAFLGSVRLTEKKGKSVIAGFIEKTRAGRMLVSTDDNIAAIILGKTKPLGYIKSMEDLVQNGSTLTLRRGVGQLTDTLVTALKQSNKVQVLTNANVTSIRQDSQGPKLTVECDGKSRRHDRLIATNPAPSLATQLQYNGPDRNAKKPTRTIDALKAHNYATTTMVVNLYYPNPHLLPVRGFGYLIPKTIPYGQNPERALGVIFASESSVGQDTAPGTKLTIMMGGHYWDGWKESDYPDHEAAVAMAQSLLKRHLGITDSPTVTRSRLQRNAIPQPTVGHVERMKYLSRAIKDEFDQRITLAGAWYAMGGTGVVDSVRQAYLAAAYGVRPFNPDDFRPVPASMHWEQEGGIINVHDRVFSRTRGQRSGL
ncbi:hypothetical protein ASPSYDRAFT_30829 [Aspergillus sydowii CBS 593.65]|uniref:Protoporphyrinogen oxidase n=1 Tax=Aspergillus sydowii CBS 593.65 TaxID=1036612 RepID=A0A1L9TKT6_9EURO|nr:uncharacterized protein ASPSYDRAFT_30829 [Aspergillus sydowii CBS 593.65]OJJ60012.1 hypothetical protein ASPSYDRAFT_30829 [Aspergillus sydowii CBS 593.65]